MKLYKLFPYIDPPLFRFISERLKISSGEMVIGMFLVRQGLVQLRQTPLVALQVLFVLRIDCLELAVERRGEEERRYEELGEAIKSAM